MNILSVDFDYFQHIPYDTLSAYPDGIDLPPEISDLVWSARCATYAERLESVDFDISGFELLKNVITRQRNDIPVCIANSHVKAYTFIHDFLKQYNANKADLTNIDLHHDIYNKNGFVDCGNWIGYLLEEKKLRHFAWIAKPLSQEMYGLSEQEMNGFHAVTDISVIEYAEYDAIFICKSEPWLLPRFDEQFQSLISLMLKQFDKSNISIESTVLRNRQTVIQNHTARLNILPH